jgi:ATP-binding cassette, subfamily B (MDR/TAP), member 1
MRRSVELEVDTSMSYDLSPRSSIYSEKQSIPAPTPITPSIRLLFSQLSHRHRLLLLIPAILSSLISGGIAPFMTLVIGQAFAAFASFAQLPNPTASAKQALLHNVGIAALQLLGLAVGSCALGSITSCLWISTGERNVMALRRSVYRAVTQKDMEWFDTKMGTEGAIQSADSGEQGPLGAGGLMSKFSRFALPFIYIIYS